MSLINKFIKLAYNYQEFDKVFYDNEFKEAVDSFINPLAGVLVLYKDYMLLSQSYFHYVPEDQGFILDNIEYNENNVKRFDKNIKK